MGYDMREKSCMLVLIIVVVCCVIMSTSTSATKCKQEQQLGIKACIGLFNGKTAPSAACCARIRVTHINCVCPVFTPELAALVDPKRLRNLFQGCGRKLPPNFKCGSITIP